MATAPNLGTLVPIDNAPNAVVLFDADQFDAFYAKLKADADAVPVDLATKKGRDAIASIAAKVRSEKASIDKDRLRLTAEWRDMTAQVNSAWKTIEQRLNGLAVEVRAPLTEWETAEQARLDRCNATISDIHGASIVTLDDTSETVRQRGMTIWAIEIGDDFGALKGEAEQAKSATIATLQAALARLKKEEAERAELEKLRAEAAERADADRIAAEDAERKENERIAAEQAKVEAERQAALAEERRAAAEKAEADLIERAKVEAAQSAQREAERQARAEQDARDRAHAEELAAERRKVEQAEREEAERIAAARKDQEEQARRDDDKAHRTKVKASAKTAIMSCGADEETARKVVMAIIAGEIPNVTLRF